MSSAIDQISRILVENDKTKTWLADKLHMDRQELNYQFNHAKKFDHDLYERIMEIFRKEGFICTHEEKCDFLKDQTLQVGAIISSSLSMLNTTVKNFTKDDILDFREKKKLSEMVDQFRSRINKELDDIQSFIEK